MRRGRGNSMIPRYCSRDVLLLRSNTYSSIMCSTTGTCNPRCSTFEAPCLKRKASINFVPLARVRADQSETPPSFPRFLKPPLLHRRLPPNHPTIQLLRTLTNPALLHSNTVAEPIPSPLVWRRTPWSTLTGSAPDSPSRAWASESSLPDMIWTSTVARAPGAEPTFESVRQQFCLGSRVATPWVSISRS